MIQKYPLQQHNHLSYLALALSCALLMASPANAAPKAKILRDYVYKNCLVTAVSDGDTIKARCGEPGSYEQLKIRLSGIDTPERKQAYGNRARAAMSDYVFGKQVDLICNAQDQYRRHICKVMVAPHASGSDAKTLDAGLGMLTLGLAWWYKAYAREQSPQDRGQYEFAEFEAKAKRAGLWADPHAVPPWEWRRTEKARKN